MTYQQRHRAVYRAYGRASERMCENCGEQAREWAWVHDTDPEDIVNYMALCTKCHRFYDRHGEMPEATEVKTHTWLTRW